MVRFPLNGGIVPKGKRVVQFYPDYATFEKNLDNFWKRQKRAKIFKALAIGFLSFAFGLTLAIFIHKTK